MKLKKILTCLFSVFILSSTNIANASTIDIISNVNTEKTRPITNEEFESITNDKYLDYITKKNLKPGDKIISSEQFYFRVNEEGINNKVTQISKDDYDKEVLGIKKPQISESSEPEILSRGYKPGEGIDVPDRWNWITLKLYTIKLETPIHNNNYQFTASYHWKRQPNIVAGKDVFGLATDGNITLDTSTFNGQSIVPTIVNPYGEATDYDSNSEDIIEDVSGVAFKHQLKVSEIAKVYPLGSISVCGNNSASSGTIGVTYAHSQITGSTSISIDTGGASISVSPEISFDTIRATAAIDFE